MPVYSTLLALTMLAGASGSSATAASKKPVADENKLICRREVETGSLVRSKKTCHTRKEWSLLADAARRDAGTMQERSSAFRNE